MMMGRVGRDKDSFNCGGHHGLVQYVAVYNGMACDFCGTPIQAGFFAKGCRSAHMKVATHTHTHTAEGQRTGGRIIVNNVGCRPGFVSLVCRR